MAGSMRGGRRPPQQVAHGDGDAFHAHNSGEITALTEITSGTASLLAEDSTGAKGFVAVTVGGTGASYQVSLFDYISQSYHAGILARTVNYNIRQALLDLYADYPAGNITIHVQGLLRLGWLADDVDSVYFEEWHNVEFVGSDNATITYDDDTVPWGFQWWRFFHCLGLTFRNITFDFSGFSYVAYMLNQDPAHPIITSVGGQTYGKWYFRAPMALVGCSDVKFPGCKIIDPSWLAIWAGAGKRCPTWGAVEGSTQWSWRITCDDMDIDGTGTMSAAFAPIYPLYEYGTPPTGGWDTLLASGNAVVDVTVHEPYFQDRKWNFWTRIEYNITIRPDGVTFELQWRYQDTLANDGDTWTSGWSAVLDNGGAGFAVSATPVDIPPYISRRTVNISFTAPASVTAGAKLRFIWDGGIGSVVLLQNCSDVQIHDCRSRNTAGNPFQLVGVQDLQFVRNNCTNMWGIATPACTNVTATGNILSYGWLTAFEVDISAIGSTKFRNNTIYNCGSNGATLPSCLDEADYSGNTIVNTNLGGYYVATEGFDESTVYPVGWGYDYSGGNLMPGFAWADVGAIVLRANYLGDGGSAIEDIVFKNVLMDSNIIVDTMDSAFAFGIQLRHNYTASNASGTATSGTTTTLTDNNRAWVVDAYINCTLVILSGTNVGEERAITGNTSTALTVLSAFTSAIDATSTYRIKYGIGDNFTITNTRFGGFLETNKYDSFFSGWINASEGGYALASGSLRVFTSTVTAGGKTDDLTTTDPVIADNRVTHITSTTTRTGTVVGTSNEYRITDSQIYNNVNALRSVLLLEGAIDAAEVYAGSYYTQFLASGAHLDTVIGASFRGIVGITGSDVDVAYCQRWYPATGTINTAGGNRGVLLKDGMDTAFWQESGGNIGFYGSPNVTGTYLVNGVAYIQPIAVVTYATIDTISVDHTGKLIVADANLTMPTGIGLYYHITTGGASRTLTPGSGDFIQHLDGSWGASGAAYTFTGSGTWLSRSAAGEVYWWLISAGVHALADHPDGADATALQGFLTREWLTTLTRVLGTEYYNGNPFPIEINVKAWSTSAANCRLYCGTVSGSLTNVAVGSKLPTTDATGQSAIYATIPPLNYYKVDMNAGTPTLIFWSELAEAGRT